MMAQRVRSWALRSARGSPSSGPPCACSTSVPFQFAGIAIQYEAPTLSRPVKQRVSGGSPCGQVVSGGDASVVAGEGASAGAGLSQAPHNSAASTARGRVFIVRLGDEVADDR